jgi:hypothetical protein
MASMWVIASTTCFSTCSHPVTILPSGSGYFSSQTFSRINTPTSCTPVTLHTYSPTKMKQTGCSETLAFKLQTPVNHPEESIRHSEHGESLKSSIFQTSFHLVPLMKLIFNYVLALSPAIR